MKRLATAVLIAGVAFVGIFAPASAATILTGDVSYDNVTGLYTYNYMLDNTNGPASIFSLNILVDSINAGFPDSGPQISEGASSFISPTGWSSSTNISGTSADPPVNEYGTFWRWATSSYLLVGQTLSGFSFTVALAPTVSTANNYFLYSQDYTGGPPNIGGGGVVEFGNIVAPDFGTAVVPIPAALPLLMSALGFFGFMGWKRKKAVGA